MLNHIRNFIIFAIIAVIGIGFWLAQGDTAKLTTEQLSGVEPMLTDAREETFPTINVAGIAVWKEGEAPTVPDGMTVSRYAEKLDHPRNMLVLSNGDILVAETNSPPRENKGIEGWVFKTLIDKAGAGTVSANRISLLRDSDGDGVAETRDVLLEGLNSPYGMALIGETLYVANTEAILSFPFPVGQTKITAEGTKVADLNAKAPNNHWTRNLVANEDGTKLYVAVGSNSNIGENGLDSEEDRAAILEFDIETAESRVFVSGTRNPVGLAYEPITGKLWTVVNERDMLGSDMVPDYLAHVEFAANYGWPWHYWGGYTDHRVTPKRPQRRQYVKRPAYGLGSHTAPLGLTFSSNAKLGDAYQNGAFVALHGSWNRKPAAGSNVVYVPFNEDRKSTRLNSSH